MSQKKTIILVVTLVLTAIVISQFHQNWKKQKLNDETLYTNAVLNNYYIQYRSGKVGMFSYSINNKTYELRVRKNLDFMEIGDTILIRYSVTHPSVAEVEDLYYMEKYKHLRDSVD